MLGIMLINTGTASEPTEEAIRDHLRVFLSDRHLINIPPVIWKPILNLFILPHRPRKTLGMYQEFWTDKGSPFTLTCENQRAIIEKKLAEQLDKEFVVRFAMRYDPPRIGETLQELADAGCEDIIALPLYPQWVRSCAGTIFNELDDEYIRRFGRSGEVAPHIIKIHEYWNEPDYIQALAASINRVWKWEPNAKLVMSFHSIPLSYVTKHNDTYLETTRATLRACGTELGIPEDDLVLAYQSRFDSRKWAGPFLIPTVQKLAANGASNIAVVSPIFSAECIETEFETKRETRAAFLAAAQTAGTENAQFTYIPALGTDEAFMDMITKLIVDTALRSASRRRAMPPREWQKQSAPATMSYCISSL